MFPLCSILLLGALLQEPSLGAPGCRSGSSSIPLSLLRGTAPSLLPFLPRLLFPLFLLSSYTYLQNEQYHHQKETGKRNQPSPPWSLKYTHSPPALAALSYTLLSSVSTPHFHFLPSHFLSTHYCFISDLIKPNTHFLTLYLTCLASEHTDLSLTWTLIAWGSCHTGRMVLLTSAPPSVSSPGPLSQDLLSTLLLFLWFPEFSSSKATNKGITYPMCPKSLLPSPTSLWL